MKLLYITAPLIIVVFLMLKIRKQKLTNTHTSIYDFVVKDLQDRNFNFSDLKGKKIMIVNTASKCGLTPQYEQLQEIYETYHTSYNFVIIGFPSNNFLFQEPGNNKEIKAFCELNYGVTFPMMDKVEVKGKNQAEIYQFLTHKKFNKLKDSKVKWNFQKYLINRNGQLERVVSPRIKPNDKSIIDWIKS